MNTITVTLIDIFNLLALGFVDAYLVNNGNNNTSITAMYTMSIVGQLGYTIMYRDYVRLPSMERTIYPLRRVFTCMGWFLFTYACILIGMVASVIGVANPGNSIWIPVGQSICFTMSGCAYLLYIYLDYRRRYEGLDEQILLWSTHLYRLQWEVNGFQPIYTTPNHITELQRTQIQTRLTTLYTNRIYTCIEPLCIQWIEQLTHSVPAGKITTLSVYHEILMLNRHASDMTNIELELGFHPTPLVPITTSPSTSIPIPTPTPINFV